MGNYLKYEVENGIAVLTINRPEVMNALSIEVLEELKKKAEEINADRSVRVLIITGVKKAFVAGADIAGMRDMDAEQAVAYSQLGHDVFNTIENMRQTTIAAVNGYALGGGCELAMSCDIRVAAKTAKIGIPEVTLGVFPGFAGTQRLPRLVGMGRAKEMLATGKPVNADRAYEIGLVNHVVENEELLPFCKEMAAGIVKNSTDAIAMGKKMMICGYEMDKEKAQDYEAALFGVAFAMHDQKEGMTAFLEKRKAEFK